MSSKARSRKYRCARCDHEVATSGGRRKLRSADAEHCGLPMLPVPGRSDKTVKRRQAQRHTSAGQRQNVFSFNGNLDATVTDATFIGGGIEANDDVKLSLKRNRFVAVPPAAVQTNDRAELDAEDNYVE